MNRQPETQKNLPWEQNLVQFPGGGMATTTAPDKRLLCSDGGREPGTTSSIRGTFGKRARQQTGIGAQEDLKCEEYILMG